MLTFLANAKINLHLEIIGSRPDGFHELVMVMQSVALADRITLRPLNTPTIQIQCDHPQVPTDSANLAYQAVALLQERLPHRTNQKGGVEITIEKKIPVGAGLAGGSSNAAAVLFGLDILWDLGLTRVELQELGSELGSDVPFCLAGGCAIATGRGEEVNLLYKNNSLHAVLAKYNSLSVSTPWAYQTYREQFGHTYIPVDRFTSLEKRRARVHSGSMVQAIGKKQSQAIGSNLYNDLEKIVLPAHPKVALLKSTMTALAAQFNALGTLMSGSGPTLFTLSETPEQAQSMAKALRQSVSDSDLMVYTAPFTAHGIETLS